MDLHKRSNPSLCSTDIQVKIPLKTTVRKLTKAAVSRWLLAGLMLTDFSNASASILLEPGAGRDDATITEGYVGEFDQLAEQADSQSAEQRSQQLEELLNRDQGESGDNLPAATASDTGNIDLPDPTALRVHNNNRVWIVSVGSSVYSDADRDGFFSNFSISLDADTVYLDARVYARILLREGDQEYQLFHTSQIFDLRNYSLGDSYRIEGKLVSNYPAAYYDVQVDLFDAYDGSLLDSVDASTHRTLYALPLESLDSVGVFAGGPGATNGPNNLADSSNPESFDIDGTDGVRNQIVREHVGSSFMVLPIAMIFLALKRRQWRSRHSANPTA